MGNAIGIEKIQKLHALLLDIVRARGDVSEAEAFDEAKRYTKCLIEVDRRRLLTKEVFGRTLQEESPYRELESLHSLVSKSLSAHDALGPMSRIHLFMTNLEDEFSVDDRISANLQEVNDLLEMALSSGIKPLRGKPRQIGKEEFIEIIFQIYEKARGVVIEEVKQGELLKRRHHKSSLYALAETAPFDPVLIHDTKSFRKFIDRYFLSDRSQQEDVREMLESIFH